MIQWLYKWLPIFFGCHQRADRSFYINGKQFPICARCTGELAGMIVSSVVCFFYIPPVWVMAALMLPMIVDGFVQLLTSYESTNPRRVVTGFLFGYALVALFCFISVKVAHLGYQLAQQIVK